MPIPDEDKFTILRKRFELDPNGPNAVALVREASTEHLASMMRSDYMSSAAFMQSALTEAMIRCLERAADLNVPF